MAAITSLLSDVVASWALRGSRDAEEGVSQEGVSLLHERRLHAIARHWAKHVYELTQIVA